MQGLAWCVRYYYRGCADWRWHYDQHYAPFAHDLATHCAAWRPSPWSEAGPLRPLEQLVTVLPAQSAALLPEGYRPLLCSDESPLTQWCPASVPLDMRGKKHEWQGVVLLPFIPVAKVAEASAPLPLSEHERLRDARTEPLVFAGLP